MTCFATRQALSFILIAAAPVWLSSGFILAADKQEAKPQLEYLLTSIGSCRGDPQFDSTGDLNGDGCINALDVFLYRTDGRSHTVDEGGVAGAISEVILVEDAVTLADPGQTVAVLIKLHNNATPLFGYSLAIRVVPVSNATGTVIADSVLTNFYPAQHLILADPSHPPLDLILSVVLPWGETGVFVNANTADGSVVTAVQDVNDVFAQVILHASPDAFGKFVFELGPATALADGNGQAVDYYFCGGSIVVGQFEASVADINGDGVVDVLDLLAVINAWGPCPQPSECASDINCDAAVTVSDLLLVISNWS